MSLLRTLALSALCLPLCAGSAEYNRRKAAHALIGIGVAFTGEKLGYPKTGIALAWGLGVGKELYDQRHGGRFRAGDVAWTGAPATFVIAIRW